jgi:hypothetical protein
MGFVSEKFTISEVLVALAPKDNDQIFKVGIQKVSRK